MMKQEVENVRYSIACVLNHDYATIANTMISRGESPKDAAEGASAVVAGSPLALFNKNLKEAK